MSEKAVKKEMTEYILAFATVLIPVALVYLGHVYKDSEAKQGIHMKYVEMAMSILQEPVDPDRLELRKWALLIVDEYSEVPIHDEAKQHLMDTAFVKDSSLDRLPATGGMRPSDGDRRSPPVVNE